MNLKFFTCIFQFLFSNLMLFSLNDKSLILFIENLVYYIFSILLIVSTFMVIFIKHPVYALLLGDCSINIYD